MKAVLKFCMNGMSGSKSIDLERMDLCDLDCYLMENFEDSKDLRDFGDYFWKIREFLKTIPNRDNYKQPNGSIHIFLENDDGTPIMQTRFFNGRGQQEVQKQIRVLYNKHWEMFHKSDYEKAKPDFRKLKEYAIQFYQEYPDVFRELLKDCYRELTKHYNVGDYGLNDFMNYYSFVDVQNEMLGNSMSLFTKRPVHIRRKRAYNKRVEEFINGLNIKNMGDAYLNLREAADTMMDRLELKPRKIIRTVPPLEPETIDDMVRQKFNATYSDKYDPVTINSMIENYWEMQPEESQEQRYNFPKK